MTPDSDADPDRPSSASAPPLSLTPNDHRAIEAAVAGVAGLLLGRVLLGRAGGLMAGIAAAGAGLLARRVPPATKTDAPADPAAPVAEPASAAPEETERMPAVLPVTRARLETGGVPAANDRVPFEVAEPPPVTLEGGELELVEAPESETIVLLEAPGAAPADPISVTVEEPETPTPAAEHGAEIPQGARDQTESAASPASPSAMEADARIFAGDAGAFAEMPALFTAPDVPAQAAGPPAEPEISLAEWPEEQRKMETPVGEPRAVFGMLDEGTVAARPPEAAEDERKITFDDHPLRPSVEIVPAAEPEEGADGDHPSDASPAEIAAPPQVKTAPVPAAETPMPWLLDAFPPEKTALLEEPEAGPREEFLIIPDHPVSFPPPIQPVVAALSAPLEPTPALAPLEAAFTPAPKTESAVPSAVMSRAPLDEPVEKTGESSVPVTVPDPEEIWRQAAVELAALRNAPAVPPLPAPAAMVPPLPAIPVEQVPAPPPFPSLTALAGGASTPVGKDVAGGIDQPAERPPWLKEVLSEQPTHGDSPQPDKTADKAFLPTIRLSIPQHPTPLAARRPAPFTSGREAGPPDSAPVALPGYRAEPLLPVLPTPAPGDFLGSAAPVLPPVPAAPRPQSSPVPAPAHMPLPAPPAIPASTQPVPAAGDAKIFVPRERSSRHPEVRKKRVITPLRVALIALLAAGALGIVFRAQLVEFWEQRILGKPAPRPKQGPSAAPNHAQAPRTPGDSPDVTIAPNGRSAPAPAPVPKKPAAQPAKEGAAPPGQPATTGSNPSSIPLPPDTKAVPESPPPPAEPEPSGPLPVNETGARELIARLLRATSADGVKPYILDAATIGPGLAAYFSSGKAVPVASWEINFERADKPAGDRTVWLFRVVTDNVPRGFPVSVEETSEGLRADWELLSQCRDEALRAFLENPAAPPGQFYAALKRVHTFPDMLPGQAHTAFFAFEIASPAVGDAPTTVFLRRGTALSAQADKLYKWETAYAPVLELAHKNGYVEITGIPRETWRTAARQGSR